jgi:dipeptidyl aminopeptidase/acylaminoacyl peptidase
MRNHERTRGLTTILILLSFQIAAAQTAKRQLSNEVYDSWIRISGESIANDGAHVMYTLERQEGDARLVVFSRAGGRADTIARGTGGKFTQASDFALFTIRPLFAAIKKARDDKKKGDDQPRDSLGILDLASHALRRIPRVQSFKLPEKGSGWVAYQLEKSAPDTSKKAVPDTSKKNRHPGGDAPDDKTKDAKDERGTTVVFRELATEREYTFPFARDYALSRDGKNLIVTTTGNDSAAIAGVFVFSTSTRRTDTIAAGKGSYRQPAWDEAGTQAAFVADRDTAKSRQRFFALYYWKTGPDSAARIVDTLTQGMYKHWLVSENGRVYFSKDGARLFFGTAPVPLPDDTTLIDEETAKLDIWSWQDGHIQSQQLKDLDEEKKRSYAAAVELSGRRFCQIGDTSLPVIVTGDEGNAPLALGLSSLPYLREETWEGTSSYDVFAVDVKSGARSRLLTRVRGGASLSPGGRFVTWYDAKKKNWFALPTTGGTPVNLTAGVKVPLYDELSDVPADPAAYGALGWTEGDSLFLVYDRYDIWGADPTGRRSARCLTAGVGRTLHTRYRYVRLDPEERFLTTGAMMLLRTFDEKDKSAGFARVEAGRDGAPRPLTMSPHGYPAVAKSLNAGGVIFTRESFTEPTDLFLSDTSFSSPERISDSNPQQKEYLWGTAELVRWKGGDGKPLEGLLYKPEGFDPAKKYPMIVYYYERNSDLLHRYIPPAPSASTVNISLYVSRGYLIFIPDIRYRVGYPGKSAYDCIMPGVKSLLARGFVDKDRMGLQGQSWGGYQTAFLVTRTKMFRAAMAGAAVSNMTSAYGGIRWESGIARMHQYEKEQSRIGATLWQRPDLFIENSPLFRADSVRTPLLLMNNDADGAVPWYQGIEFFNALRRLDRPVWMLVYNGEAHNLVQRKNRKDLSIRMLQFFDHYLMDRPAPGWMSSGLPAIEKGKILKY